MDKETQKYVLAQQTATAPRCAATAARHPKVATLVGIRRSGKTYLLDDTMRRLIKAGVDRRRLIYVNFEDDRLLPICSRQLHLILRVHEELCRDFVGQKKDIFFEAIQNAPGWETFVRRLDDSEEVQIR